MLSLKITRLAPLLTLIFGITGCSANCRFYPIQGPLATQVPPPIFMGKATVHPHKRTLTTLVVLSNGEQAAGTLTLDFPPLKHAAEPPPGMSTQWDAVYGQGSYTAKVLGQGQDARGTLTGSKGTTMDVEVHYGGQAGPLEGVAQDNKGNLYKVTF